METTAPVPQLFNAAQANQRAMLDTQMSRQAQEVQAAMIIAKKFPRDENQAFQRIIKACQRKSLAEEACYVYKRGDSLITGPSIRMAEALAQNWGNIDFGVLELEQHNGESTVMTYAWDLETNARSSKVFTVKHERHVGKGDNKEIKLLTDPRDIYEMTANQGARRLRACILAVIPGDIVEAAVSECERTMAGKTAEPLIDRVRKMVVAFGEYGVSQEMIEARLGHNLDATIEQELVQLRKIYQTIRDGMGKREDYFEFSPTKQAPRPPKREGPPPNDDQVPGAEAPPRATTPAETPKGAQRGAPTELIDFDKPVEELTRLCARDGLTIEQLFAYLRSPKLRVASKTQVELGQLSTAKLHNLLSNWNHHAAEAKKLIGQEAAA